MIVQSRIDIERQSGICHWKFVSKSRDMTSLIIEAPTRKVWLWADTAPVAGSFKKKTLATFILSWNIHYKIMILSTYIYTSVI